MAPTKAGVVMTPVNWRLAPAEARYIIEDSEARLLFVGPEFIDAVAAYTPHARTPDCHRHGDGLSRPVVPRVA